MLRLNFSAHKDVWELQEVKAVNFLTKTVSIKVDLDVVLELVKGWRRNTSFKSVVPYTVCTISLLEEDSASA